ncbi:MAG: alpha-amylase family glycosyl hydrolase [Bacteroidota bacterium]|jgi:glycosidase
MIHRILLISPKQGRGPTYRMRLLWMLGWITGLILSGPVLAQVERTDPPNWFCGMSDTTLNLLVKGKNISSTFPVAKEKGIFIRNIILSSNPDYVLLQVNVSPSAKPGTYTVVNKKVKGEPTLFTYQLLPKPERKPGGLSQSDIIYLLMPDRFSNGDSNNDSKPGMQQTGINRDSMFLRHGGDLKGVNNHLDHIASLGVTALWMNPFLENNEYKESYHGYAITDHYRVDPRLGDMNTLMELRNAMQERNIKMVMDIVPNHCGDFHYLYRDMPFPHWFNRWNEFTRTSYRAGILNDTHKSYDDLTKFSRGWFDKHMPDLNQSDPIVQSYLIQSYLWWIANARIDALRIDTYAYSDQAFMLRLLETLKKDFPDIGVFGEVWDHAVSIQAGFQQDAVKKENCLVPGITDFMANYGISASLNKEQEWTDGVAKLYYTLAQDHLYADATKHVVFLDNHDVSRFFSVVHEDVDLMAMGITWLLTTRGIPCLYYGTEILMKNDANPDGKVREDFPGGWKNDVVNKFDTSALNTNEKRIRELITTLSLLRQKSAAIGKGSYKHFVPEKNIYVYAREHENEKILVIMNTGKGAQQVNLKRFMEVTGRKYRLKNMLSGQLISFAPGEENILVQGKQALVLGVISEQ